MSNYYSHPFVSNSDLSKLKKELQAPEIEMELKDAYRMGALVDAMITEPERVYHYDAQLIGTEYTYLPHEFEQARKMAKSFVNGYKLWIDNSEGQKEFYEIDVEFEYNGVTYCLDMRCKFDLYNERVGTEIKTTACTNKTQFASSIDRLDYDRAAYIYMKLSGLLRFQIIGISKKAPYDLFAILITPDHPFYHSGRAKASELAFKYYMLKS